MPQLAAGLPSMTLGPGRNCRNPGLWMVTSEASLRHDANHLANRVSVYPPQGHNSRTGRGYPSPFITTRASVNASRPTLQPHPLTRRS
jgi:hypothetical protein